MQPYMLEGFRALDLTDEKGFCCGRVLADLGVDVIKVERPGGDLSRSIGPFYHDIPDLEKSLYWFAYNANKRGITLNVETTDGQQILRRLARRADFMIESFTPGYLDKLGLGYAALSELNPRIILASITPFGQTGPYKDYKGSDLVCWALSGYMYLVGDPDRPPVRFSFPMAYALGGIHGAAASLVAHYYRELSGEGQHVDVSIQEVITCFAQQAPNYWYLNKALIQRGGSFRLGPLRNVARRRFIWPCKDGYVVFTIAGGRRAQSMQALVKWMDSEGLATEEMKQMDWYSYDASKVTQKEQDDIEEPIGKFILEHNKKELYDAGLKRRMMLYGVSSPKDIREDDQLAARDYWVQVEHPELRTSITYPGAFVKFSAASCGLTRRAPLIGEHNEEIYKKELGLSKEELVILKQGGII